MTPKKRRKKLSPNYVDDLKPSATPYRVWDSDTPQLFIRVQPSGIKSWNVQWSRLSSRALGKWPGVTVASARAKARAALVETAQHGQPLAVIADGKPKADTLREYIENEYRPWASANKKWGAGASDRILSVFAKFADRSLTDLTMTAVEAWRIERLKDGTTPNTCNRDLATLKSAIKRAVERRILESDPLAKVKLAKVDSTRVRYLSEPEEARLRKALAARDLEGRQSRESFNRWRKERGLPPLPPVPTEGFCDYLTPAVLVSLNTGLRRGELTSLDWTDIDFDLRILTVRASGSKSGKMRRIPLNDEAAGLLKRWKRQNSSGRVFPFKDAKKAWATLLEAAKVPDFRWHDLRHSFASKLVMRHVDLNTVRELMGHETLAMTLRYAHLAPGHKAKAVELLCTPTAGDRAGKRGKPGKTAQTSR